MTVSVRAPHAGQAHSRAARWMELALWGGAALLVIGAHAGGAAWLLRAPPVMPADDQPPAAIMMELATLPEAISTAQTDISPDMETTAASTPAQKMDAPQAVAEDTPTPPPDMRMESPQTTRDPLPAVDRSAVALPATAPPPPARRTVERKKREKPKQAQQQPQATSRQALQAQAQVTPSTRNAAQQTASGTFSSLSPATWQSRLMAHLERRKTYPPGAKARGERGTVFVRFSIDETGRVLSASLARSSGFAELDQEVLAMVRRASPVPAPPPGANRTITAPVRFNVR